MNFTGEDGPNAMFQWFDTIEVTFRQSGCPENLHTVNATGVFQSMMSHPENICNNVKP
ncbi:hypothetical protein Hanom_Chr11g01030921 [Helianthus anomalus]